MLRQIIVEYKNIRNSNQTEELDKEILKTLTKHFPNEELTTTNEEKEKEKERSNVDDINEIIRNFNSSKESLENMMKEIKISINDLASTNQLAQSSNVDGMNSTSTGINTNYMGRGGNSNVNTNYTNTNTNNNNNHIQNNNITTNTTNSAFPFSPITNLMEYNIDSNGNLNSNQTIINLRGIINQLLKENSSLKIELKILSDSLKSQNVLIETGSPQVVINKEEMEKILSFSGGTYNNKKASWQSQSQLDSNMKNRNSNPNFTHHNQSNNNSNENSNLNFAFSQREYLRLEKEKEKEKENYLLRISIDEKNTKDIFFLDVKKYINILRQNEFFIS